MTFHAVALVAALLAGEGPVAAPGPPGTTSRRVAVSLAFLGVGRDGTRTLAEQRRVVEPGTTIEIEQDLPRLDAGRTVTAMEQLAVEVTDGGDRRTRLSVRSRLRQRESEEHWDSSREAEVADGTSTLVELAPERAPGEKVVLSLTVVDAAGEEPAPSTLAVDAEIAVTVLDGEQEMLLQQPRLRTLAGRPLEFAFDYPVPSEDGGGESVRCEVVLAPASPRDGRLPVRLRATASFPDAGEAVETSREDEALLRVGEPWSVKVTAPGRGRTGFRLDLRFAWKDPHTARWPF
jgi:hypothetical protein